MRIAMLLGAVALATATPTLAVVVDFEAGPFGGQAEGFSAVGVPGLTFTSANGSGLLTGNFGSQGNGNSLAVLDDTNGNFLIGTFATSTTNLSLGFGNDDPGFINAGDLATLRVFNGITLIQTVTIALTPDDIYNQFISYSGGPITSFSFAYTDAFGSPFTGGGRLNTGLTEVVDDITFGVVPEPATWGLMIAGFGMVGAAMRRRATVVAA